MLRLRLVAGVRRAPTLRPSCSLGIRTLFQTRSLGASSAVHAQARVPPSRQHPSMRRGNSRSSPPSRRHELPGPVLSERAILAMYPENALEQKMLRNPKDTLGTYIRKLTGQPPHFAHELGYIEGKEHWRATIHTEYGSEDNITGVGDHLSKGGAERLASMSVLLQAAQSGKLHQVLAAGWIAPPIAPTMSDGSTLTIDRAKIFMDYYCLEFGFESPNIATREIKGRWEAIMSVGESRLGAGYGINKKLATVNCYLDVVRYLDESDPELWKTFLQKTKGRGDAVGLAPPVYLSLPSRLADQIGDLTREIKGADLYRNSPPEVAPAPIDANEPSSSSSYRPLSEDFHRDKSSSLQNTLNAYMEAPQHSAIRDQRFSLPIHTRSAELLELVNSQDVTICMAATGSGKTTQIPQIILDDWIQRGEGSKCNIICTQPRRIAAISVAERVAKERGQNAGRSSQVGYQVRFDAKLPAMHGSVTFCTTGIFLKRMQTALLGGAEGRVDDRSLDDVTHIVIDEVHERDVDTDLTLAVLKRLLAARKAKGKPVKVILMSATIDPTLFQSYFQDEAGNKAKVIDIPGRSFPVEKHYLEEIVHDLSQENIASSSTSWVLNERSVGNYLSKEVGQMAIGQLRQPNLHRSIIESRTDGTSGEDLDIPYPLVALTIAHVLRKSDNGHVLVFLPGWDEIQAVNRILSDPQKYPLFNMKFNDKSKYSIHLLHSTIPVAEQQQVFEPAAPGIRRIILATNIAETSITIPDVVYVVDTGKVKEKRYDPERHMSSLVSAWVGSSNLNQRAGRAGRHRPGEYYGLVSKARAAVLNPYQMVEMKRADLSNVVMHVKALDFRGMDVGEIFSSLIEPPATARVEAALQTLEMAGALTSKEELTPLGRVLLQIPIDAALGRMVLYGALFKCLDPALTLAAILSNREPFVSPPALKSQALAAKMSFATDESGTGMKSDPIAALRAYEQWWELQGAGKYNAANEFCNRKFLSKPTLMMVGKVKTALLQALHSCGVLEVANGGRRLTKMELTGGDGTGVGGKDGKGYVVPEELNANRDSEAVLSALVAIGSQPKFAVRTSERAFRTYSDRTTIIHPGSTNATMTFGDRKHSSSRDYWEKYIVAYGEKSRNVSAGQDPSSATTFLRNVTRIDNMQYMLFGAYKIKAVENGFECDDWLPMLGSTKTAAANGVGALEKVAELKNSFETCMQRVFEGIHARNVERTRETRERFVTTPAPAAATEADSDDDRDAAAADEQEAEDDDAVEAAQRRVATRLSRDELTELGLLSRDIVRVLQVFNDDRRSFRLRSSRPGTPTSSAASTRASPTAGSGRLRLPDEGGLSAFARALKAQGGSSPMSSRPSTPSSFSRG